MFAHPLWLVGFRPFFNLAFLSAVLLPLLWALTYAGALPLPESISTASVWHAHEMLFGFGWAVLGGFLLTASKNWVNIRGLHGGPLALAVLLWVLDRVAILLPSGGAVGVVRWILLNAFAAYLIGYLVWTLVRYRGQDTFKDNVFFIVGLPLFLVAKNLLVREETFYEGHTLAIGLFRLAFAVMFERTITAFMKGATGSALPRSPWLDRAIKVSLLLSVFEAYWPEPVAVALLSLAALLLLVRWFLWRPLAAMRTFGIAIMYVGYLGLVLHLALSALRLGGVLIANGTVHLHTFNFLCMGVIIPAMLIRLCQGHTGRKILFTRSDQVAFGFMFAGAFFRLVATQLWGEQYVLWISVAAICWSLCFLIIAVRVAPFLWRPRVDGREH